jgi:hypothetical protein
MALLLPHVIESMGYNSIPIINNYKSSIPILKRNCYIFLQSYCFDINDKIMRHALI